MNILILTGKFGLGHYKAATAVKEELEGEERVNSVEIVDIIDYIFPLLSKSIYRGFEDLVSEKSDLYNVICKNTGKYTAAPFKRIFVGRMRKLFKKYDADLVVSTLPMCSQYVGAYKHHTGDKIPLITCITDISSNDEWIADCTNLYVVATTGVKAGLMAKGIGEDIIKVGGIPVRAAFKESCPEKNTSKEVLIMGGGLGLIPNADQLLASLNDDEDIRTTIITGTNKKLYKSIKDRFENIRVIAYTENVHRYMKKADVLISKPGGITMFEAINCETPIFAIKPFLEQEISNAIFIESNSIGKIQWDDSISTVDCLKNLLMDEKALGRMKWNMEKIKEQQDNISILEAVAC